MMKKLLVIALVLLLSLAALAGCTQQPAAPTPSPADTTPGDTTDPAPPAAPAYPTRTIEFVVPFSAGGGSDIFARTIVSIINQYNMVDQTINVVNRTGGGGAIGYAFTAEQYGDPYFLAAVGSSFYNAYLVGQSPVNFRDFRVVGALADESLGVWVRYDSPITSLREAIEMVREEPGSLIISSTGGISLGSVAYYMLQHEEDVEFSYVPFDGGADALTALLGGHVDITLENPGTARAHHEAGTIRLLAIAYEHRIPGFEDVPTFREEGVDIVLSQVRGFIMPAGTPDYAIAFWEDIFRQVFETPEFQEAYLLENSLIPLLLNSEEYLAAFEEITAFFLEAFATMGFDVVEWD